MRTPILLLAALPALLLAGACRGELGEPEAKPLPVPDAASPLLDERPRSPRLASYRIDARLDAETHRIEATQTLTWKNSGRRPVDALRFHLYMNAFKNEDSVFMRESGGQHRGARAAKDSWGWIEVDSIRVGATELRDRASFPGPDETVLEVPLDAPVEPGAEVAVDMRFTTQLPEVFARTGYKGEFTMVGQWFPKIGVLVGAPGQEVWHCEPFHLNSEFFADFGAYDVTLTVPETMVVAATGVLADARDNGDGTQTLTYRAEDVHDFAWMADPYMDVLTGTATTELGDVEVRVYHRPRQRAFAERHLRAGIGAIEEFSRLYVPYPWPIMSIVDPPPRAAGGAGGMEYPTIVTTAGDSVLLGEDIRLPEYVTVHEVGHNWFQGMLASNEVDEAWLDEGVNDYADGLVMAAIYGDEGSAIDWHGFVADSYELRKVLGEKIGTLPAPIATKSYEFPDSGSYGGATYTKTALALRTLESVYGSERWHAAMKRYAKAWAFRHPTGRDFFATLESSLGEDLEWYVEPAFYGRGVADFRVRSHRCRAAHDPRGVFGRGDERRTVTEDDAPDTDEHDCQILVVNLGDVPVPVDVDITLEDGTVERVHWDHRSLEEPWLKIEKRWPSPVAAVTVDPDERVLLDDGGLDRESRVASDGGPSRRAAARISFWTQTIMQGVGL